MRNVHDTHIGEQLRSIHASILDIVVAMNRPRRDEALMREAGVKLDQALFPLLVGIERFGPLGVVDLAERAGRDYTTVSRQVAKLESLGLVARRAGTADRRVREAVVTEKGAGVTRLIDAARDRMARAALEDWNERDVAELARLLRKLADTMVAELPPPGGVEAG